MPGYPLQRLLRQRENDILKTVVLRLEQFHDIHPESDKDLGRNGTAQLTEYEPRRAPRLGARALQRVIEIYGQCIHLLLDTNNLIHYRQ